MRGLEPGFGQNEAHHSKHETFPNAGLMLGQRRGRWTNGRILQCNLLGTLKTRPPLGTFEEECMDM